MATSEEAPAPSAEPVLAEEEAMTDEEAKIQGLAKTLEEKIAAHGERAIECGPAYVEYARALLAKSQAESDPLGGAIKREDAGAQPSGAGTSSGAADEDADDAEEGGEEGGEEGEAEGDDLELAFQCLEVARLIYEEAVPAQLLPLSGVLECLGDVAMENEMWDEAIDDLTRCLELKKQLYAADDRELAHTHYQLATAALASMEKCRQDAAQPPPPPLPGTDPPPTAEESAALVQRYQKQAIEHYSAAAEVLEAHLAALRAKGLASEGEAAAAEIAEVLADVKAKVEEVRQAPTSAAEADGASTSGAPASGAEGVTTIGFGGGAPADKRPSGFAAPSTTIGFGGNGKAPAGASAFAPAAASGPVKDLGVVGRGSKRVRLD